MGDPYFAILVSDEDELMYYKTLGGALEGLSEQKGGVVVLFYLCENDRIKEDPSEWWTWDHDKRRVVKNRFVALQDPNLPGKPHVVG